MRSFAILIDGGFAKRKIGTAANKATAADFAALIQRIQDHAALQAMHLHRVYYYDALPLEGEVAKPLGGGKLNLGANSVAQRSITLLKELARQPFVALRLGELSFEGWHLKDKLLTEATTSLTISAADLQPKISQKGVDMRIGMDIAALTLKRQAQVLVLVTGDSDFVPAMKFARREGAALYLAPLGHRLKAAMYEHSDLVLDLPAQVSKGTSEAAI